MMDVEDIPAKRKTVHFSPVTEVREYTVIEQEEGAPADLPPSPPPFPDLASPSPAASAASSKPRGRPKDTPEEKAKKEMLKAEKAYEDAQAALWKKRWNAPNFACFWYGPPCDIKRSQDRLEAQAPHVAKKYLQWQESIEHYAQVRIVTAQLACQNENARLLREQHALCAELRERTLELQKLNEKERERVMMRRERIEKELKMRAEAHARRLWYLGVI